MARVITDRVVIDSHFIATMTKAWGVDPSTKVTQVARATYLIDFASSEEMGEVLYMDYPWLYRQDIIAMRRATGHQDLKQSFVDRVELWTQLHNLPHEAVTDEGVLYVVDKIWKPVSDVR